MEDSTILDPAIILKSCTSVSVPRDVRFKSFRIMFMSSAEDKVYLSGYFALTRRFLELNVEMLMSSEHLVIALKANLSDVVGVAISFSRL